MFIVITIIFASIISLLLKLVLGKYFAFLVPIPTLFLIILITIFLVAAQALGAPVSSFYAWFFSELSKMLSPEVIS